MHRAPKARIFALLLLTVFVTGGTVLPGLDAALYHRTARRAIASPCALTDAGAALDHAERCTLGRIAPAARPTLSAGEPPVVAVPIFTCVATPPVSAPPDTELDPLRQPRAPPVTLS
jgi:hypothetical protein